MKKHLGILHLSDIHACAKTQETLNRLTSMVKSDLDEVIAEHDTEIVAICITGDLVNSGDNIDAEMGIATDFVIHPLLQHLNLAEDRVFIVPGNHEVKRSLIVDYIENGLFNTLSSETAIEKHLNSGDQGAQHRISDFDTYSKLFGGMPVMDNGFCRAYQCCLGSYTIGIACVNSAWRSTGIGGAEKGKMIVGAKQIVDSYEAIKNSDITVCLLHHPLDWLIDCDKNSVEKCIHQFDIVLNGHIHESSSKVYTTFNGHSLFNTCGKFDNSSDIYNGYSVISINPYTKDCNVILRQYFGFPRNCYDKAINLCSNGTFLARLGCSSNTLGLAYNIASSIKSNFTDYANRYFISNVTAGRIVQNFDEAFIPPLFSEYSDYEKETVFDRTTEDTSPKDEEIEIDVICSGKDNLILLGQKESGKTTTIHYLVKTLINNFNAYRSVPIIIDCQITDFSGKNVVLRAAMRFINEYCSPEDSFSQENLRSILQAGLCTIMFDGFDEIAPKELQKINDFLKEYPCNRFIFCEKESISTSEIAHIPVKPDCTYKKYHLRLLTKKQIRAITQKSVAVDKGDEKAAIVDRIMLCFKNTSLPKTPFVLSVILSLCDSSDFSPINEAVVLEQFMELLLGKHSPTEAATRTFDFRAKEDFLIALVSEMLNRNSFFLSYADFSDFVTSYHTRMGFDLFETKFDRAFFTNGVLVRMDQIVKFRYNCMVEYYIAKKAAQEPEFLESMLKDKQYIHFTNELLYYTGLNRRSIHVLKAVQKDLQEYYKKLGAITDELNNYEIEIDVAMPEEDFTNKISEGRLTQEESDRLSDVPNSPFSESPETIDKLSKFNESKAFIETFLIFGICIKNLEFIDRAEKDAAYNDYLLGLTIILAMMKHEAESSCEKNIAEMRASPEKYTDEDFKRIEQITKDFVRIVLPLGIQNIALENIGTVKLKNTFEAVMKSSQVPPFYKFFSTFILCDLRVSGVGDLIRKYTTEQKDHSLLKIVFFKLLYYYQFRYFGHNLDTVLENALADINLRLKGQAKFFKSAAIKQIQSQRIPQKDLK